ncbi:hypothetical protein C8024_12190 [Sphingopyxis sp. BSNA05]|nr:hypothetical protein [Sphingopyxis sp. BSNA05]
MEILHHAIGVLKWQLLNITLIRGTLRVPYHFMLVILRQTIFGAPQQCFESTAEAIEGHLLANASVRRDASC